MRLLTSILTTAAILLIASAAHAQLNWSVSASTSDGSPLLNVTQGAQITLDITMTTTDQAFGLAGSVNNYNTSVVTYNSAPGLATELLGTVTPTMIPSVGTFPVYGGETNLLTTPAQLPVGPGVEVEFVQILSVTGAAGDGTEDDAAGGPGIPQFSLVFDAVAPGSTTFQVGTYLAYLDQYTGGTSSVSNNQTVAITVPEPAAMASGLAALGSVFAIVGIRRRL